jgi:hypothetical protein
MTRRGAILCALVIGLLPAGVAESPSDDVVMQSMLDELERSKQKLQLGELAKPYFISYMIVDVDSIRAVATFGSLQSSYRWRYRQVGAEVRVGSYEFDNTNFVGGFPFRSGILRYAGGRAQMTLEDDPRAIRRTLWLATDDAYKDALEKLSLKRAALQNKTRSEEIPDFSREEPLRVTDEAPAPVLDMARAEAFVRELSAVFRELPEIFDANVVLNVGSGRTRYINSEGSRFDRTTPSTSLVVAAQTQAEDGLPLEDFLTVYGRVLDDLPAIDELKGQIRRLGGRLASLRDAPLAERYNGPVLFEEQAAAELFARGFAPKLLASRVPVTDDPRTAARLAEDRESFRDRVGARVLPRFFAVTDDPTAGEAEGRRLAVAYKVDDQGVPARETILIVRGILKTLLTDRTPVQGVPQSNGHSRGRGILPSNLLVSVTDGLSEDELRREFLLEIADRELEYGILVRRIRNQYHRPPSVSLLPSSSTRSRPVALVEAYRVYADGREEPIRNAEISGLTAASFKDIIAASAERFVHTVPLRRRSPTGSFTSGVYSLVVPSLLFEDLTIIRPSGEVPKPPVYPHPFFEREVPHAD